MFGFTDFLNCFSILVQLISTLLLVSPVLLFALSIVCSSIFRVLRCNVKLLIWDLSFKLWVLLAMNFTLSTDLAFFRKFWHGVSLFSFTSKYFLNSLVISSLSYWLLIVCYLISTCLWLPQTAFCKLISSFIPLWPKTILCTKLILLTLLKIIYDF